MPSFRSARACLLLALTVSLGVHAADPPGQPTAPDHPGSSVYAYSGIAPASYRLRRTEGFLVYFTDIVYAVPQGEPPPNGFPVLAFHPGKTLSDPFYYQDLLVHVARKGYAVILVDAENSVVDCRHDRMADDFLAAVDDVVRNRIPSLVDPGAVAFAGHSMGAKVVSMAAGMTASPSYVEPTFVVAMAFSDDDAFCDNTAYDFTPGVPADVAFTLVRGADDTVVSEQDSFDLYDSMPQVTIRQILRLETFDDYAPALVADHALPMTSGCVPLVGECGEVDALDWYGSWKFVVGGLGFHFSGGDPTWLYGVARIDGGVDSDGIPLLHTIERQSF